MIKYIEGNLLESPAQALVNTVNTVGVMGKGVALQFKNNFPNNYRMYLKACKEGTIEIGKLFVFEEESMLQGKKIIINFPTKTDWRKPSEYSFIDKGLTDLIRIINAYQIKSIAIPPLGSGNGGLIWNNVKEIMETRLKNIDCDIHIYQPNFVVNEVLRKERVKLTPARAMLLSVLFDLVRNGEFVSEFASEKIAYFLQRFGAQNDFKLDFHPDFYGPYSGKVKHVLYYLNGSYISGYSAKDKKPFEELDIIPDAEPDVNTFLGKAENNDFNVIAERTKSFLKGFYSAFGLELLSTVDFIMQQQKVNTVDEVTVYLENWSDRKKTLFSNPKFVSLAVNKVESILKIC
jgi:O-acetyl-ADP-ribose deacetylase (regulator of RNase III)